MCVPVGKMGVGKMEVHPLEEGGGGTSIDESLPWICGFPHFSSVGFQIRKKNKL
jgi:hypothetical protein